MNDCFYHLGREKAKGLGSRKVGVESPCEKRIEREKKRA